MFTFLSAIVLLCINTCLLPFVPVQSFQLNLSLIICISLYECCNDSNYLKSPQYGVSTCHLPHHQHHSVAHPLMQCHCFKLITFVRIRPGRFQSRSYERGTLLAYEQEPCAVLQKNFHFFLPSLVLPSLSIIFRYSPFSFLPTLVHSAFIPSLSHCTCNFGKHLSISLASFELSLNTVFSPHFNQHLCLFVTPQLLFSRSRILKVKIALAQASSRQLPNNQSASWCHTPHVIGSGIKMCRTASARQTQSYRAGPVQCGTHLFTVDVVRTQSALEPWYWSSVNGVIDTLQGLDCISKKFFNYTITVQPLLKGGVWNNKICSCNDWTSQWAISDRLYSSWHGWPQ